MDINVSVDDVKKSAKLFDYGDNSNAKQITDGEIQYYIDKIKKQITVWIKDFNIEIGAEYNIERYIILETIIALALSNYNDSQKTYIEALKAERDKYFSFIEKSLKRFASSKTVPKMPSLLHGRLFD